MFTATIRKNDGTYTLEVPTEVVEDLHLTPGSAINVRIDGKSLALQPRRRSRYTADELLAQCDFSAPWPEEDEAWDRMAPVGRELL